jgi:hypothetical protein
MTADFFAVADFFGSSSMVKVKVGIGFGVWRIGWVWRPPQAGVPEVVSRQTQPLRSHLNASY